MTSVTCVTSSREKQHNKNMKQKTLDEYLYKDNQNKFFSPYDDIKEKLFTFVKENGPASLDQIYEFLKDQGLKKGVFIPLDELWSEGKITSVGINENIYFVVKREEEQDV